MNPHPRLIALACATLATVGPGCSDTPSNPPVTDVPGPDLGVDVPTDAGADVPATDLGADVPGTDVPGDAPEGCNLPGYGLCARGTSCVVGRCPDGSPVSCFCNNEGQPLCTGACPPPPPTDASVTCGQAQGGSVTGCAPASLVLDPAICRCILGYYWDGRACVSSANCQCLGNCEQLYPSREACAAAYARCG